MYKIVKKEVLNSVVVMMEIEAPYVAARCEAGQFVIVRVDEDGERIPLTIADFDRERNTVEIIFQERMPVCFPQPLRKKSGKISVACRNTNRLHSMRSILCNRADTRVLPNPNMSMINRLPTTMRSFRPDRDLGI